MLNLKFITCAVIIFLTICSVEITAKDIQTSAPNVILYDLTTNTTLIDKNSDTPMPPASMSKLMTVYMVFDRLRSGSLNLDDKFLVSRSAWRKGGSKMFVMVNKRVSVKDLLKGIIVQSGNDACIVIAEGISGTEEAFADAMTRKAREIGLKNSSFTNSTGWPDKHHYMSARDIAKLSAKLIQEFPELYKLFSEKEYTFGGIKQGNRNPLLYNDFGADGLKTGYTQVSGYGLAASAVRKGRRLLLVINGLTSSRARSSEAARLLDWGFRDTVIYPLFKKGEEIEKADVWLGKQKKVSLVFGKPLILTLTRKARRSLKVKLKYDSPIPAPIKKGDQVGLILVEADNLNTVKIPVTVATEVQQQGNLGRLSTAFKYLLFGNK